MGERVVSASSRFSADASEVGENWKPQEGSVLTAAFSRRGCQIQLAEKSALFPLRSALFPLPTALFPLTSALSFPPRSSPKIMLYNGGRWECGMNAGFAAKRRKSRKKQRQTSCG
jgi:hypothetical protein